MVIEKYDFDNILKMDPMHDSYATDFIFESNQFKIVYDDLKQGVLDKDGNPYYKHNKVTITYKHNYNDCSYVDIRLFKGNKFQSVEVEEFFNAIKGCKIRSFIFNVDAFQQITLSFSIYKYKNGKYVKYKYSSFEIQFDLSEVIYEWE